MAAATETRAAESGSAFSWRFVTPLFIGSALNPINSWLGAVCHESRGSWRLHQGPW